MSRRILFFILFYCGLVVTTFGENKVTDVCNLDLIYNNQFIYSLPRQILESYFSGVAFDNKTPYSPDEFKALCEDINELYARIIAQNPLHERVAVMTAGAPGSGKTLLMRQNLEKSKQQGRVFAYIDPDDVCLRVGMPRTYGKDIKEVSDSFELRKKAYDKWRPASNAACQVILANLIKEGLALDYGTTSTSPQTAKFLDFLKKQGYEIHLLYISAPDSVRWESIKARDKTFVQTTEADTFEKGRLLPQRIMDTYLAYADYIEFYFRTDVDKDGTLAAVWKRNAPGSIKLGTLEIRNKDAYNQLKKVHNDTLSLVVQDTIAKATKEQDTAKRQDLQKKLEELKHLTWEETLEANSEIK